MKDKIAKAVMSQVQRGIEEANNLIRPLGAQAMFPQRLSFYEIIGETVIVTEMDFAAWLETGEVVRLSSKKMPREVVEGG